MEKIRKVGKRRKDKRKIRSKRKIGGRIKGINKIVETRKIVEREMTGKRKGSITIRKRRERKIAREKGSETEGMIMKRRRKMIIKSITGQDQEIGIQEDEIMIHIIQSIHLTYS